jgi:hypothetical protein
MFAKKELPQLARSRLIVIMLPVFLLIRQTKSISLHSRDMRVRLMVTQFIGNGVASVLFPNHCVVSNLAECCFIRLSQTDKNHGGSDSLFVSAFSCDDASVFSKNSIVISSSWSRLADCFVASAFLQFSAELRGNGISASSSFSEIAE